MNSPRQNPTSALRLVITQPKHLSANSGTVEERAAELLRPGSLLSPLIAALIPSRARSRTAQRAVVRTIHETAAELAKAKALADREVAETESLAMHEQARSQLLIHHRQQHDQLQADARTDLIRGMTGLFEQKQDSLAQLDAADGDPELKQFAAAVIASTYDASIHHLANQHRSQTRSRD